MKNLLTESWGRLGSTSAGRQMTKWELIAQAGETNPGLKDLLDKAEAYYLLSKNQQAGK